eukprot:2853197-Rhodomonas_salina.1
MPPGIVWCGCAAQRCKTQAHGTPRRDWYLSAGREILEVGEPWPGTPDTSFSIYARYDWYLRQLQKSQHLHQVRSAYVDATNSGLTIDASGIDSDAYEPCSRRTLCQGQYRTSRRSCTESLGQYRTSRRSCIESLGQSRTSRRAAYLGPPLVCKGHAGKRRAPCSKTSLASVQNYLFSAQNYPFPHKITKFRAQNYAHLGGLRSCGCRRAALACRGRIERVDGPWCAKSTCLSLPIFVAVTAGTAAATATLASSAPFPGLSLIHISEPTRPRLI